MKFYIYNGPFLTVNQSTFTEVEVVNQWYCRAHNNLCTKEHALFVCDQACEQLTQEWIENGKRTISNRLYMYAHDKKHPFLLFISCNQIIP